ncbi:MAG: DEAD/DEAH box helicase family protein [Polyangiaceae bacterium]|nr:DEAD/DEAH box helicase family protein [Polyangiaceae bacterium]
MAEPESVFLEVPREAWVASNEHAFAFRDRYPVSPGHTLVVTHRAVADWFSASEAEQLGILRLIEVVKRGLDSELHPDGYNVGFNAGTAAGQTVMHLHVHVIPRFRGDMDDPRGGVRHVIPSEGNYLHKAEPLATGGEADPFSRHLLPLFDRANDIAIVAAFVQESGLWRISDAVERAVRRGATVRILTGDYLEITQASALELLLDWQRSSEIDDDDDEPRGRFEARVIEVAALPGRTRSFHPKSWRFQAEQFGVAFVGSSNLSRSALDTGVEWNLRVDRDRDSRAYSRVLESFESLWSSARVLDAAWVQEYAERARRAALALPAGEAEPEPHEPLPDLHDAQVAALAKLREARENGRRRALVVLATGLGKTLLAAADYKQLREELGARPRLLFVAHRRELLRQAARTYRRQLREMGESGRVGWFAGDERELTADLVFASVAKLARRQHVDRLRAQRFDYVVVDEVHHASARSYQRILDAIDPKFLLGLTATPDRADAADILGLFDDFVAYRADISRGVALGRLVPFHYYGVKDDIDYAQIPWRNKRFDPEALALAAQTEARMQTLWRAWQEHPGQRTLVFCCSIAHASYVRGWLRDRGLRVNAVFSEEGTDDRESSLEALESGDLDALCAVDVFNEGVDIPSIDRVAMLRPTESSVLFLQQLGRGLRASPGKDSVTVIDFVGNDRVFLERVRALLSIAGTTASTNLRSFLESKKAEELPAGCSVELELEAKKMLEGLFRVGGADEVERVYRELKLERGQRPSAGELQRMGYLLKGVRDRHGSWFEFVRAEGDLAEDEARVLEMAAAFLREVEVTEMEKCFKMVTLEALLEHGALTQGMPLRDLAIRCHQILRRTPALFADIADDERIDEIGPANERKWLAYWRRNPVNAWTSEKKDRRVWFRLDGDRFCLDLSLDATLEPALASLTRELVDYRLAQYRARKRQLATSAEGFVCKVTWNKRDPILKPPGGASHDLPRGETDVRLPDGSVWQFRFAKEFCNVARPVGVQTNQLPDLLRRWFGPSAGQPGTSFEVRFHASPDGLWADPVQGTVVELAPRRGIVAYPELRAAAGHAQGAVEAVDPEHVVVLPVDSDDPDLFAVRVLGTSMDGGKSPMRNSDWAVMRVARGAAASALENRVVLVQLPAVPFGSQYQIKRLERRGTQWALTSDNPEGPSFEASEGMVPIARLERVLRPEDLAPAVGTTMSEDELSARFGVDVMTASGRYGGHLFIFVDRKGLLEAPDQIRYVTTPPRPGETAYVLSRQPEGAWRFLGVGHQLDDGAVWRVPDVDYETWRTWGEGREVSRRLPQSALARAQLAADAVLALPDAERWLTQANGRRARVLGPAQRGGLRLDGGEGGFEERTVSLTDIAWSVVAEEDVRELGGVLDEQRVNRLRYLEGTPKGSTRWIDTGWAIAAWNLARPLISAPIASDEVVRRVHRDDGEPINATFTVERVGDAQTVVIRARGGARGSSDELNTDYAEGLELVLRRLGEAGFRIADAQVESRDTAKLSPEDRRLPLPVAYPVAIEDSSRLRKQISAAQAKVGRAPGARGGGNQNKRIRLFLADGDKQITEAALAQRLERAASNG